MFTGIIQEIGILQKREKREENLLLTIQAPILSGRLQPGESVAANGVCLTVEQLFKDAFRVALMPETTDLTNLGKLHVSSRVNLEPALPVNGKLDGHFVTGHIDGMGKILEKDPIKDGVGLKIRFPSNLGKFLSLKGSITVNGVSLTVIELEADSFTVGLIPYTQQHTNLGTILIEETVNLEIDLIARYLDRLLSGKTEEIKYEWLKERNFL